LPSDLSVGGTVYELEANAVPAKVTKSGLRVVVGNADTDGMSTSGRWIAEIEEACVAPDPASSNRRITILHYRLSEALADALEREGGPNFHSWAVWGSRKAGVTIRQEDLDSAIRNATTTSIFVGSFIGVGMGVFAGRWLHWSPDYLTAAIGAAAGAMTGGWTGRRIAIWSRARAAELILLGNRIVLRDIGEQSARFLELLESGATCKGREEFFAGLRSGATEEHGQDRLAAAFRSYLAAFDTSDLEARREAMIAGNCEIVYHEHIRLEPYIRGAMPWIVRRCTTERWMTFEIGERILSVGEDVPGTASPTAARDWAKIEERMRYVFALFRRFHEAPEVFSTPYAGMELDQLANLDRRQHPAL
jgi:hypothetical protein